MTHIRFRSSHCLVQPLIGDQSDTETLHHWIRDSGGSFDVIIDDGGHSNMQMYNSFVVLFLHALKVCRGGGGTRMCRGRRVGLAPCTILVLFLHQCTCLSYEGE